MSYSIIIYISQDLIVTDSSFTLNNALTNGGAINHEPSTINSIIDINNSLFIENNADDNGGAVALINNANLTVSISSFSNNQAGMFGGALFIETIVNADISNSLFDSNIVMNMGSTAGAIYSATTPTLIRFCTFTNNQALSRAGAVQLFNLEGTVDNCIFELNVVSSGDGAAIFIRESTLSTISNSIFNSNQGMTSGALDVENSDSNINNCTFTDNFTDMRGGAIFLISGN